MRAPSRQSQSRCALETCTGRCFVWPDGSFQMQGRKRGRESPELEHAPVVFLVENSLAALQHLATQWRSQLPVEVVGITGSIGKSTTKETVANVLATRYVTLRSEGNLNNEIGLPLTLLRLRREHERAVLEMGMYTLGEIAQFASGLGPGSAS